MAPKAASKSKTTEVTTTSDERVAKKSCVRFNFPDGSPVTSIYLDNDADGKLGNPESVTLTIEAA